MKLYKIRHKKSGFFWQPDKGSGNVGRTGKVYSKKPSLVYTTGTAVKINSMHRKTLSKKDALLVDTFNIDITKKGRWYNKFIVETKEEDWEVVEIKVID